MHDVKLVFDALLFYVLIISEVHDVIVDDAFFPHVLMGVEDAEDVEMFRVFVQLGLFVVELVLIRFFVKL